MSVYLVRGSELTHHGIKGMKWGKRRFQNADGSLTAAGKARYRDAMDVAEKKAAYKSANKEARKAVNKTIDRRSQAHSLSKKRRQAYDALVEDAANKTNKAAELEKEYKSAKKAANRAAVKDYRKKFDTASKASDVADQKWRDTQEAYKSLGKNKLQRIVNAAKGNTAEAKRYKSMYDEWEKSQNFADKSWSEAKEAYSYTGKTYVGRVINNMKYDLDKD